MKKKTCMLFSGGKDSMYALQKMRSEDNLDFIISIKNSKGNLQFHAGAEANNDIRKTQLDLIGLPYKEITTDTENYLQNTFSQLKGIVKKENVGYIVTGDLWFPYGKGVGDMLAAALGVEIIRPCRDLCHNKNESQGYMNKVLDSGIESIVYSVRKNVLPKKFIGNKIDKNFLKELERRGIDVAGELSEYQSFVTYSPIMSKKIIIDSFDTHPMKGRYGRDHLIINNVEFHVE